MSRWRLREVLLPVRSKLSDKYLENAVFFYIASNGSHDYHRTCAWGSVNVSSVRNFANNQHKRILHKTGNYFFFSCQRAEISADRSRRLSRPYTIIVINDCIGQMLLPKCERRVIHLSSNIHTPAFWIYVNFCNENKINDQPWTWPNILLNVFAELLKPSHRTTRKTQ